MLKIIDTKARTIKLMLFCMSHPERSLRKLFLMNQVTYIPGIFKECY